MENSRDSIILAADLPDHAEIEDRDRTRASERASRFHQLLGECIYAYDGVVHETTGSMVVAELTEPNKALQCIETLQRQIRPPYSSEAALTPRAVLTCGEVHEKDFSVAGDAVQNALSILDSLTGDQMLVSSAVLNRAGVRAGGDPVLTLGGAEYFALPISASHSPRSGARSIESGASPSSSDATAAAASGETSNPLSRRPWALAVLTLVVVLLLSTVFLLVRRSDETPVVVGVEKPAAESEEASSQISVSIGEIVTTPEIEQGDLAIGSAKSLIAELLASSEKVEIASIAPNRVGVDIRMITPEGTGRMVEETPAPAPGPTPSSGTAEARVIPWVERSGERFEGPPSELEDVWSIVIPTVRWGGERLGLDTEVMIPQSTELRGAFADVAGKPPSRTTDAEAAALHAALGQEPRFLPGWLALSKVETDDRELALLILDGLRNVSRMMPGRTDLARELGKRELEEGTLIGGVEAFARVRTEDPEDEEATRILALAALAAHQPERFQQIAATSRDPRLHPADVQVTEGEINEAVRKYYETQAQAPDNPYLSFKVGRIAVLRRSPQIAQIEIERLESQGAEPQRSFLRALIAADEGRTSDAEEALTDALDGSEWSDSPWFHAAEVHAILQNASRTLAAIERSVERREPMMHAVATNPLFGYLKNEPRFREAVRQVLLHQRAIGASLADYGV
ncbi:MAG: hypothetical protein KY432_02200 [Acidobacteria bacterium]|nr:hypothetical protein [Acidobacteriota bacterium]